MITYSIIKKSQLEGALRMDAEYYQPEYLAIIKDLSKFKISQLKNILSDIRYGLYVEPDYQEEGVNFLRALNLVDYGIDGEILKIKEKGIPSGKYLLNKGDILIVRSGANTGNVGIIENYLKNSTFGSYTICLRTKKVNPYFLYIFLTSKFGKFQTLRLQTGMAQPNLNIPNIEEIKIPLNIKEKFQKGIEEVVLNAFKEKENAKKFYSEAEDLLLEELGLKDFENKESLFSIVNLSDVKKANRIDAEYFQSKYEKLISKIKNYKNGFDSFNNLIEISNEKIKVEPEKKYKYIELADVNENLGIVDNIQEIKGKELPSRARMKLQKNDVIVSSVEGSTDKVALINEDVQDLVGSTGFFILKEKYFKSEVNLILTKSVVIKSLLMREAQGTILTAIPSSSLKKIILPKLENDIQRKITDLVQKSHEARKKSKELLAEAKTKVEKLIENNK